MNFGKPSTKAMPLMVANKGGRSQTLWQEAKRLMLIFSSAAIVVALVTYHPADPSWTTWASRPHFHNWMGRFGSCLSDLSLQLMGLVAFAIPLFLLSLGLAKEPTGGTGSQRVVLTSSVLFFVSLMVLIQALYRAQWMPWQLQNPGGLIGRLLFDLASDLVGKFGAALLSLSALLASAIFVFHLQILTHSGRLVRQAFRFLWSHLFCQLVQRVLAKGQSLWRHARKNSVPKDIGQVLPMAMIPNNGAEERAKEISESSLNPPIEHWVAPLALPKLVKKARSENSKNKDFALPGLGLLSGKAESKSKTVDKNWYIEKATILVQKLKDFGVEGEVVHISPGPVITVYEFKPASGVKIKEISNLSDDLTLALSALSVRIVAPIPGKPVVGIEIPSPHREMVFFKDLIQETPFFSGDLKIPIVLGRLASGEPVASDLASMPHLLVAGTTGTGKSVFINTLISSLLYRFSPDQLKLILVDPKMVELSHYEGIPHLLLPVVVDSRKAVLALRWTVEEMERRYTLMHQLGVRQLDAYNEKIKELQKEGQAQDQSLLPYMVVVIDEYADLMAVVPKDVELSIARLAQKARASGIHLVLATQRPSTDVVTGTIKANFPSRISFRVASSIDSKTILDRTGAERLLGHGDLLFHSAGFTTLKRMQGPFLSDADLNRIVEHLKSQGEPQYDERILEPLEAGNDEPGSLGTDDEAGRLYDQAVRLVAEKGEASISLIQRHLRIGYNRAASLMEQMEKEGVVGQSSGASKRRSVNVNALG